MAVAVVRGAEDEDVSIDKDGDVIISRVVLDAYDDVVEWLGQVADAAGEEPMDNIAYNRMLNTNPREVARRLREGA